MDLHNDNTYPKEGTNDISYTNTLLERYVNWWMTNYSITPRYLPDMWQAILPNSSPDQIQFPQWTLTQLSKFDQNNKVRIWQIGFDGIRMWKLHGFKDGATNIDTRGVELNSTGRTLQQQAYLECCNLYRLKIRRGYVSIIDTTTMPNVTGMKGQQYKKGSIKNWEDWIADVKMDGIRMLVHYNSTSPQMLSNGNKSMDHLLRIREELIKFAEYLPPCSVIDGELFNIGMSLPEIQSAALTRVGVNTEVERLSYFVFDIWFIDNPCTEIRTDILSTSFQLYYNNNGITNIQQSRLRRVPKWKILSEEQLEKDAMTVISYGFEGLVLRRAGLHYPKGSDEYNAACYKFGRTANVKKVKRVIDDEGIIVKVVPIQGSNENLGMLVVYDQYSNYQLCIPYGSHNDRVKWLHDPSTIVGKVLCFKYALRDPSSGIPIHARGKCIRMTS